MNIITLGPRTLPFSSSIGLEEVVPFAACSPPGSLALQEAKRQCDQLTVDWSLWTMRKRQPHVPAEADFLRYFVIVIKWRHSCLRTQKHRLSERCKGTVASASSVELQWDVKLISHVQVHPPQFTWHLKVTQFLCQANFLGVFWSSTWENSEYWHQSPSSYSSKGWKTVEVKRPQRQYCFHFSLYGQQEIISERVPLCFIFIGDEVCFYL